MKKIYITLIITLTLSCAGYSQIGIGTPSPDASAVLHLESSNKGFLPPRVALKSKTDATTIPNPATGLIIYNTATAGAGSDNVVPGLMINAGTAIAPIWSTVNAGVTTNDLRLAGNDLVSEVNGVSSSVDLNAVLPGMTTNVLSSVGNTITSDVNGKAASAPAVNAVANTLSGKNLTTSVNGVSSTVDLTPALAVATTNVLSSTGNTITSNVNGVSSTTLAVNSNVLALNGTNLTSTVNGVTSNIASLSGLAGWGLAGNDGTAASFLGTKNNEPLRFRANNDERMTIATDGRIGIGNTAPTYALDVVNVNDAGSLASFRPKNLTQGVAIGWAGISKIGTLIDSDFKISPKGKGKIDLDGPVSVKTLAAGAAADDIVTADKSGNLRKRTVADVIGTTTNVLSSSVNTITSTVNGKAATANAVNTNELTLNGTALTSTVNGVSSTSVDLSGLSGWGLAGNDGTATSFLGTKNNQPLIFKTNDAERMRIGNTGNIGIGVANATLPLQFAPYKATDGNAYKISLSGNLGTGRNTYGFAGLGHSNKTMRFNSGSTDGNFSFTRQQHGNFTVELMRIGAAGVRIGGGKELDPNDPDSEIGIDATATLHVVGRARIDGLTSAAAPVATDQIVIVDASSNADTKGNLKRVPVASILSGTTNTLSSSVNTITSTVNGIAASAPAVNAVANTLSGKNLTTSVNGVSSTVDLTPALAVSTTNVLSSTGNTITSNVNGVSSTTLAVNSNVLALNGTALTSTVNGVSSTSVDLSGFSGWGLNGNKGIAAANFLGTTDNQPLRFRTNNTEKMTISAAGKIGIGNRTPAHFLDVISDVDDENPIASFLRKSKTKGVAITSTGLKMIGGDVVSTLRLTPKGGAPVYLEGSARILTLPRGAAGDEILTADPNGNLRKRTVADVIGTTTNALSSAGNTITSTVNGVSSTADAVNTNELTLNGTDLTSTVNGVTSNIASLSGLAGWGLAGNNGTATSFLGTKNNQPLIFKTNDAERMRIGNTGNIGIGVTNATLPLQFAPYKATDGNAYKISLSGGLGTGTNTYNFSGIGHSNRTMRFNSATTGGKFSFTRQQSGNFTVELMRIGAAGVRIGGGKQLDPNDPDTEIGIDATAMLHVVGRARIDGLTAAAAPLTSDQIVVVDASNAADTNGNLKRVPVASILSGTTNTLSSSVNTITSTVNGKAATAKAVNTNELTLNGTALTSTVNGVSSTSVDLSGFSGWGLNGNKGIAAANFLGTTDNQPLRFRTNNTERMTISAAGKIGIRNASPANFLDVVSDVNDGNATIASFHQLNSAKGLAIMSTGLKMIGGDAVSTLRLTPKGGAPVYLEGSARIMTLPRGAAGDEILTADSNGNLRKRAVADVIGATTNVLSSSVNTITSTVNGKAATANAVNTNALTLSGTALTSTVNGVSSTSVDLSGLSGWGLAGNAGTAASFLGTTNNEPLRLRANNSEKMTITPSGKVGIGNSQPKGALDVISPVNGDDLARFEEQNRTQGVAINYEGISKFGTYPDSDFKISPKGAGIVNLNGPVLVKTLGAGAAADQVVTADAAGNLRKRPIADVISTVNIRRVTANVTLNLTDYVVLIDAPANTSVINVTLPALGSGATAIPAGKVFKIKRVDNRISTTGSVTIRLSGAGTIDETDTTILLGNKKTYELVHEGGNKWQTLNGL